MKGGVFNRPECCNQPCECPVCLENKPLMRLNCNHYVCLEDIQNIINSNPRRLQRCPICRQLITDYGCNGNITHVTNNSNQQNDMTYYEEGATDSESDSDDEMFGGRKRYKYKNKTRRKTNKTRRKTKSKKRNTKYRHKYNKKSKRI